MSVNSNSVLFEKGRKFHRVGGCSCLCHCLRVKSCAPRGVPTGRRRSFRPPSSEEFPPALRLLPIASGIRAKVPRLPRKASLRRREKVAGSPASELLPPTSRASVQNLAFWVAPVSSMLVASRDSLSDGQPHRYLWHLGQ